MRDRGIDGDDQIEVHHYRRGIDETVRFRLELAAERCHRHRGGRSGQLLGPAFFCRTCGVSTTALQRLRIVRLRKRDRAAQPFRLGQIAGIAAAADAATRRRPLPATIAALAERIERLQPRRPAVPGQLAADDSLVGDPVELQRAALAFVRVMAVERARCCAGRPPSCPTTARSRRRNRRDRRRAAAAASRPPASSPLRIEVEQQRDQLGRRIGMDAAVLAVASTAYRDDRRAARRDRSRISARSPAARRRLRVRRRAGRRPGRSSAPATESCRACGRAENRLCSAGQCSDPTKLSTTTKSNGSRCNGLARSRSRSRITSGPSCRLPLRVQF